MATIKLYAEATDKRVFVCALDDLVVPANGDRPPTTGPRAD